MARKLNKKKRHDEVTRPLTVILNAEEREAATNKLVDAVQQVAEAKEKKKAASAKHQKTIKALEEIVAATAKELKDGREEQVECIKTLDFEKDKVTITRKDTGETVEERKMEAQERQMDLGEVEEGQEESANA